MAPRPTSAPPSGLASLCRGRTRNIPSKNPRHPLDPRRPAFPPCPLAPHAPRLRPRSAPVQVAPVHPAFRAHCPGLCHHAPTCAHAIGARMGLQGTLRHARALDHALAPRPRRAYIVARAFIRRPCRISCFIGRPMLHALGALRFPFIAASGALLALCIIYTAQDASRADAIPAILFGALLGGLAVVVLYALMRSLAERQRP